MQHSRELCLITARGDPNGKKRYHSVFRNLKIIIKRLFNPYVIISGINIIYTKTIFTIIIIQISRNIGRLSILSGSVVRYLNPVVLPAVKRRRIGKARIYGNKDGKYHGGYAQYPFSSFIFSSHYSPSNVHATTTSLPFSFV